MHQWFVTNDDVRNYVEYQASQWLIYVLRRLIQKWMIHLVSMWLFYITRKFHSARTEHFANTLDELIARPVRKSFSRSGEVDHLLTVTACLLWPSVMNSIQDFLRKIHILYSIEENAFGFGLAWLASVTNMAAVPALLCLWQCETHGSCRWG